MSGSWMMGNNKGVLTQNKEEISTKRITSVMKYFSLHEEKES